MNEIKSLVYAENQVGHKIKESIEDLFGIKIFDCILPRRTED